MLGRDFLPEDDRPGAQAVVVKGEVAAVKVGMRATTTAGRVAARTHT